MFPFQSPTPWHPTRIFYVRCKWEKIESSTEQISLINYRKPAPISIICSQFWLIYEFIWKSWKTPMIFFFLFPIAPRNVSILKAFWDDSCSTAEADRGKTSMTLDVSVSLCFSNAGNFFIALYFCLMCFKYCQ